VKKSQRVRKRGCTPYPGLFRFPTLRDDYPARLRPRRKKQKQRPGLDDLAGGYWELSDGFGFRAWAGLDDWCAAAAAINAAVPARIHSVTVRGPAIGTEAAMPVLGRWAVAVSVSGRVLSIRLPLHRPQHRPARRHTRER